jgi:DNA excision repair protein ERCC-5
MLAMLLGCDYTPGVHGIGIVNGAEIVSVYDGFEGLKRLHRWATRSLEEAAGREGDPLEGEEDCATLRKFKEQHKKYRLTWQFPRGFPSAEVWQALAAPVVDKSDVPFSWGEPVERKIVETLTRLANLPEVKARELLRPTLKRYKETQVQRKITDFFRADFDCGSVGEIVSARLKKVVR